MIDDFSRIFEGSAEEIDDGLSLRTQGVTADHGRKMTEVKTTVTCRGTTATANGR